MFYLISNGQIVGTADYIPEQTTLPEGWICLAGPSADRNLLYFDGSTILPKPEPPSGLHHWNTQINQWEPPIAPEIAPTANWDGFIDELKPAILAKVAASPMSSLVVARISRLADRADDWKGESDRLVTCWNAAPPQLTAGDRKELNRLAEEKNLPIRISDTNQLILG